MLFDDKKIEEIEYKIYMKWVNEFSKDIPPIKFVYVQADPEVSFHRILQRNRHGEIIPIEYLQNCHNYHDTWLLSNNPNPMLVLNANKDITKDKEVLDTWLNDIHHFIYQ